MNDYTNKTDEYNSLYDKSLVIVRIEKPEIVALKSLGNSLFNNMIMICFRIITTINLILLGRSLYKQKVQYPLFMTFQIGVFILEILGKYFIIGLIKYVFGEKKEMRILYNLFIQMKTALIFIIPLITIPASILSYYIIEIIFQYIFELRDISIIKEVDRKFLLFTPIIYFFEILFLLNLRFLNTLNLIKDVFIFILAYVLCHVGLSVMLMFFFDFGLFGLTISYGFNSIFFFICSDIRIYNIVKSDAQNYFFLIPNIPNMNNFDWEIITNLKEISHYSLFNLGEVFPNHFIFFASMFLGPEQLIVNIIYLNFFELVIELNRGFKYSIKRDIKNKIDDANDRQIYIAIFSTYYLLLNLPVFITLLIFKNILLNTYIYQGASAVFQELAGHLRIIYPLCIMAMAGKIILNGITRVMEKPMSIVRKIIYILISMFICYLLCFFNNFGLFGLWISMIVLDLLHVNENLNKVIRYFPCCSRDNN
jgi:hypothetical protein